ncbi:MAG: glycosyltransferase [Candidatus Omnitrophica bacterium]|nr:glycosyltransferase [Candidatus Omnitrophota bacterium]
MEKKAKIIIAHASAGAGHRKAAEAIFEYLKDCPELDVCLVDVLTRTNSFFRFSYQWGYSFLVKYLIFSWGFLYWLTDFKPFRKFAKSFCFMLNKSNTKEFSSLLIKENPDFVISTHFLPSEITSDLKEKGLISTKLFTIITDFGVHSFWIADKTDYYGVASSFTKNCLVSEGIPENRIKEIGIPVDSRFLVKYNKSDLCRNIGVDSNKFTVLLMTGSFGIGPMKEIAEVLCEFVQVIVVCAANKKLLSSLNKRQLPNVKVLGFVDNAYELMAVSDVIITKPGGLSISEIISMELVPIFISAIPGQETINIKVLNEYSVGVEPKTILEIKNLIIDYKDHPEKITKLKDNIKRLKKPGTLEEIRNVVRQNSSRASC